MSRYVQSLVIAVFAVTGLTVGTTSAVVTTGITPLGDLSGGSVFSAALGGSGDTSVVAGYSNSTNGTEAFRWTSPGPIVGLGDLSPNPPFLSQARGVSGDGNVIVGQGTVTVGSSKAFRWTSGTGMVDIGDLTGGITSSIAFAASMDGSVGSVIAGQGNSGSGPEAFRYVYSGVGPTLGTMTGIGDLSGGTFNSAAYGVSNNGSVIVGQGRSGSGPEAFRWVSGVMTGLGDLTGGSFNSIAYGVSGDGLTVVGQGNNSNGDSEAFRWNSGIMTGLGDLPGGSFGSVAYAVSSDGSTTVGQGTTSNGDEAVVWQNGIGMMRLWDGLVSAGIDPAASGWTSLTQARGISADGTIVAGFGVHNGNTEAFVSIVPEPGSLALLGLSGATLFRRRRIAR